MAIRGRAIIIWVNVSLICLNDNRQLKFKAKQRVPAARALYLIEIGLVGRKKKRSSLETMDITRAA